VSDPIWLVTARADIGTKELPGAPTAPKIAGWLKSLKAWWSDDATPWCGVASAAWMQACAIPLPKAWYRAKDWLNWGLQLEAPITGCVVVFERTGGGHVGLVEGVNSVGQLMVLGGNQGDMVSIRAFDQARAIGYRWPPGRPLPAKYEPLRVVSYSGVLSTNEA
jgi:uncharacterized protein (TIGR02594 family)